MSGLAITPMIISNWRIRCQKLLDDIRALEAEDPQNTEIEYLKFQLIAIQNELLMVTLDESGQQPDRLAS